MRVEPKADLTYCLSLGDGGNRQRTAVSRNGCRMYSVPKGSASWHDRSLPHLSESNR
jgi:hypothetical protein